MTDCSSHRSWISLKAEAARSEHEGVGTPDSEALFASNEGVKQPTVLAAGAGYHLKAEAARSESLFSIDWSRMLVHKIYISDFSIISTYRQIKTISAPLPVTFTNILQSLLC
ncbi:hypothetical protein P5757_19475 [Bacillus tropicus]|uniref:hypothetical protein n=1 Tax=Bacillus tropicus TaxID=2026188 RepID=UPI00240570FF|nr:hypothetical protein [Bacillus tropicus]MDF9554861.1 hypothetical protein [Bacillus tropicus]MDF9590949.1 hypothetical protein [Bacillus tropicus]MDF9648383.1 hypothetical protein [Bacillus tropicus]HDR7798782.1 hypothetical protein [Bacillus tropicus]